MSLFLLSELLQLFYPFELLPAYSHVPVETPSFKVSHILEDGLTHRTPLCQARLQHFYNPLTSTSAPHSFPSSYANGQVKVLCTSNPKPNPRK